MFRYMQMPTNQVNSQTTKKNISIFQNHIRYSVHFTPNTIDEH